MAETAQNQLGAARAARAARDDLDGVQMEALCR
jgi:hypothetical protein